MRSTVGSALTKSSPHSGRAGWARSSAPATASSTADVAIKVLSLLERCLEKDPKKRLRDIGDAMPLLEMAPRAAPAAPIGARRHGGVEPVWAKDGRELFYLEGTKVMSVVVDTKSGFNFKPATALFESRYLRTNQPPSYDVAADGRFLMIKSAEAQVNPPITVVLNWEAGLKK